LFATLDTLTRRIKWDSGDELVISDTVGFVRKLPHQLVAAFAATLEETAQADLLLHVVDASAADRDEQIAAVTRVLNEIGAGEVPQLLVYNKIDCSGHDAGRAIDPCGSITAAFVSAVTGAGIADLRSVIREHQVRWRQTPALTHNGVSVTQPSTR
jgi:GTP-binding protein HflX